MRRIKPSDSFLAESQEYPTFTVHEAALIERAITVIMDRFHNGRRKCSAMWKKSNLENFRVNTTYYANAASGLKHFADFIRRQTREQE